jgi:hypothetical protein
MDKVFDSLQEVLEDILPTKSSDAKDDVFKQKPRPYTYDETISGIDDMLDRSDLKRTDDIIK